MASDLPIVRQIAWISAVPQLTVMGLLIFAYYIAGAQEFFFYGSLTYLVISFGLRYFIAKDHRQGMNLVKQKKFQDAIPFLQKSYAFFTKNAWVDKYRFLTVLSSVKMSYKEMALNNIAFCYEQLGNKGKAIEYYNQVLEEYPDNEMAQAALDIIQSDGNRQEHP